VKGMIEIKYGIVYSENRHYYSLDLREKPYNIENTSPYRLIVEEMTFTSRNWGDLIQELSNYLIARFQPTKEFLLSISLGWSNQVLFSDIEKKTIAIKKLDCGLWVGVNHTSIHLCWIVELLLSEFAIDIDRCSLLIHRMPGYEPEEVRNYYYDKSIQGFERFLDISTQSTEQKKKLLTLISKLDVDFRKQFPSYHSFFLFESRLIYSTIKGRFIELINKRNIDDSIKERIKNALDQIMLYYRSVYQA
jgi:hypothetical protein